MTAEAESGVDQYTLRTLLRLREAIQLDIEDAKATCGGDGLGCEAFRPYFDNPERRYRKCGQCPMEALSNIREAMSDSSTTEE